MSGLGVILLKSSLPELVSCRALMHNAIPLHGEDGDGGRCFAVGG
jgi:hypothetical protein